MPTILIIKTGALGDVLRTTSILPGLVERHPGCEVTWITAPAAETLVARHPLVQRVVCIDSADQSGLDALALDLSQQGFDWVISLDDEHSLCRLASSITCDKLSGALLDADSRASYSEDTEPWFGMGLIAKAGKQLADARKLANRRSHPQIFAEMLGLSTGRPELLLPEASLKAAGEFAAQAGLDAKLPVIGLNTGAGGRWPSKELPIERVVAMTERLHAERSGQVSFLLLGGPEEAQRNHDLLAALRSSRSSLSLTDAGTDNAILDFAARIALCDVVLTSDSLALHLAIASRTPVVAFFAPTSAAEIELYGLGTKLISEAPDYCSYRADADNSSITVERLVAALLASISDSSAH